MCHNYSARNGSWWTALLDSVSLPEVPSTLSESMPENAVVSPLLGKDNGVTHAWRALRCKAYTGTPRLPPADQKSGCVVQTPNLALQALETSFHFRFCLKLVRCL